MADDVTLNAGTGGDTIAADDILGIKYQRVKIALGANNTNDGDVASGNPMPVSDAGGSLTIDGTVTANAGSGTFAVSAAALPLPSGASTAAKQPALGTAGTASTDVISVQGIASMTPVQVSQATASNLNATVIGTGTLAVQATVAAGATTIGKAEDVASANADVGVPAMAVRKATPANTSGLDGDYEMLQMSAGRLWTSATVDAALPAGTNAIGKLASNTGVTIGAVEIAAAQTLATVTTVSTVTSVTAIGTSVTPGTSATHLGKAEDAAHTTGDTGVMALAVRQSAATDLSAGATNGDYEPLQVDALGKLWVTGSYAEDTAHTAADTLLGVATRRIDTAASSAGSSGDYATLDQSAEGALWATLTPTTTSGCSTFMASGSDGSSILVATAQVIKASAGVLYGYYAWNPEAAVTFVHFYNTAAASVTVGTTNPLFTIAIPAGSAANLAFPYGVTFSNAGWSCAATTTAGGNTAPATGVSLVAWYK